MGGRFSVKFPIESFKIIDDSTNIFLVGSCFTENIGTNLATEGFSTLINPFGILFNPVSICHAIEKITENKIYSESDLFRNHENRFVSFDHHGRYSGMDALTVINQINQSIQDAREFLLKTDCVFLTLGTSWVYRYLEENRIVANCHKVPGKHFSKELLDIEVIFAYLKRTMTVLRRLNPEITIVLTISPVKHLKDGIVENQVSKAALILAVHKVIALKESKVFYFPAYEIVTEELRDYRFFESDFAHPNKLAIDYVWDRFKETCFTLEAMEKSQEAEALHKQLNHRNLHAEGSNENLTQRIRNYINKYPLRE